MFDAVQTRLDANARTRRASGDRTAASLFTGRIFDTSGQPMSPTFAYGRSRRLYRYYVSADLQQGGTRDSADPAPRRISAEALETLLARTLQRLLPDRTSDAMALLSRIEVHRDHLDLTLPVRLLRAIRKTVGAGETVEVDPADRSRMRLTLPARLRIRSGKTEILTGESDAPRPDTVLIRALRTAHAMLKYAADGTPTATAAPATPYRRRLIRLAFLAPDLQRASLDGLQPRDMDLAALMDAELPLSWTEQRRKFGAPRAS